MDVTKALILDAHEVLERKGIEIESRLVLDLLSGAGCTIIEESRKGHAVRVAKIRPELVEKCMRAAPARIELYSAKGESAVSLGKDAHAFSTGSCGRMYCSAGSDGRPSTSSDLAEFIRVADRLEHVDMVSTAMVPHDIDPSIQDAHRLFEVFKNSDKPVITGIFPQASGSNFERMKDMLLVIRGSEEELKEKPLAVFDCAPEPLKWSRALSECIIDCGTYGIPVEFVSMPQPGLSYPVTLYEAVVQSIAETLAGFVISQTANENAPAIWGGSPMTICFEKGRTDAELASPGTIKMVAAYASVAERFQVPTHMYAISDSLTIDAQYGMEKQRAISAALHAGINNVTGLGMFGEEDVLACEALVIDNDIVGAEKHIRKGIEQRRKEPLRDISFLADEAVISPDTARYLRSDEQYSSSTFNRDRTMTMLQKASEVVDRILAKPMPEYLSDEQIRDLKSCLT